MVMLLGVFSSYQVRFLMALLRRSHINHERWTDNFREPDDTPLYMLAIPLTNQACSRSCFEGTDVVSVPLCGHFHMSKHGLLDQPIG